MPVEHLGAEPELDVAEPVDPGHGGEHDGRARRARVSPDRRWLGLAAASASEAGSMPRPEGSGGAAQDQVGGGRGEEVPPVEGAARRVGTGGP